MTKPKKMIVLSHGRTGSTYLIKALNRHPDFDMKRELFFSNPDMRPDVNGEVWEKVPTVGIFWIEPCLVHAMTQNRLQGLNYSTFTPAVVRQNKAFGAALKQIQA